MNRIYLIGNLSHSPELRTTQSGKEVCNFSMAVNRRFRDADGERKADFFNVQVWGQQAAACANYLAKGRKVGVSGTMQSRQYEGKDGAKKTAWDVIADEVEFLTPKGETDDVPPPAGGKTYKDSSEMKRQAAKVAPPSGFTIVDDEPLPF